MPWAIPQPDTIAESYSAALDAAFKPAYPQIDSRGANSVLGNYARAHGQEGFGLYLFQASLAQELMIDTAQDWLPRHADQWGVAQIPASTAIGAVVFAGLPPALPLPAGIELVDGNGNQWAATASAVVAADGTAHVPVAAEAPGVAGNVPAGNTLSVISAVLGLQGQSVTVDVGGIAGGEPAESNDAWRARILARVRQRGASGAAGDYVQWAKAAGALLVGVIASWVGPGSVGVVIAVPDPAGGLNVVPSAAQLAAFQAALDAVAPVTAQVVALPVTLQPVAMVLALNPDTVVTRGLATAAFAAQLAAVPIGGVLAQSRLVAAITDSTGGAVELAAPAADLVAGRTALLVPGPITFVGYA